jgi:tRNA threonylcarbamoyladenosine biosynthesis protein TsaE
MLLHADSLASTHAIAAALAALARTGDVIVLAGEMGAGKTAFAQGFGRALGVTEPITSPTFTLVHSYACPGRRATLHHADLYRLETTGDIEDLALRELAEFDGIVLVEWGDVAAAGLGDHLEVRLAHPDGDAVDLDAPAGDIDPDVDPDVNPDEEFGIDTARVIEVQASGSSWAERWERVTAALEPFAW